MLKIVMHVTEINFSGLKIVTTKTRKVVIIELVHVATGPKNWEPFSARYAGPCATYCKNPAKIRLEAVLNGELVRGEAAGLLLAWLSFARLEAKYLN